MEFFEIADIVERAFIRDVNKHYLWLYLTIAACVFAVLYVFKVIALFTIARREGYKNKWMAFLPFFNTYYIGVVSERNSPFRVKTKIVSLFAAILEAAVTALYILYYVAMFRIFGGGYAEPVSNEIVIGGLTVEQITGYKPTFDSPANLSWAWWIYDNLQYYVVYWLQIAFIILNVFVLMSFFRTYAPSRAILFAILCILFPITGIMMFVVRGNAGVNYTEFIKEQQQRQYNMYRDYMRYSGGQGDPRNSGGYDPYSGGRVNSPPEDPFDGLGASGGNSSRGDSDPFDEFKN